LKPFPLLPFINRDTIDGFSAMQTSRRCEPLLVCEQRLRTTPFGTYCVHPVRNPKEESQIVKYDWPPSSWQNLVSLSRLSMKSPSCQFRVTSCVTSSFLPDARRRIDARITKYLDCNSMRAVLGQRQQRHLGVGARQWAWPRVAMTSTYYVGAVQLLLTYGPFYKNVRTCGPLPIK